jgi:hypothetical protein
MRSHRYLTNRRGRRLWVVGKLNPGDYWSQRRAEDLDAGNRNASHMSVHAL